jgi:molybdopterin-containing oxidoreductase family membrane subunit
MFAAGSLMSFLLFVPLAFTIPPSIGRRTIWMDFPFAPWLYDGIGLFLIIALGLTILYYSAVPDFAAVRDQGSNNRSPFYARLALNWQGGARQWAMLRRGLVLLGVFYIALTVLLYLLIPVDFSMTLVPGWISSVYPVINLVTGLQNALAVTIIALYLWNRIGGLERYIRVEHIRELAKILLPLSLLWFYMRWADFFTRWYGRTPREQALLSLLEFGPYFVPWLIAALCSWIVPLFTLVAYRVRNSFLWPTLISVIILVGNFFDQIRCYVSAYSIADPTAHQLEQIPATQFPDVLDVLMVLGALGGAILLFLLATKFVPPLAIYEMKQDLLLRRQQPFLRGEYTVLGKPD